MYIGSFTSAPMKTMPNKNFTMRLSKAHLQLMCPPPILLLFVTGNNRAAGQVSCLCLKLDEDTAG